MGWIELQIQERIFNEFINCLRNDGQTPSSVIENLITLWQTSSDFSYDELQIIVEEGSKNDG